jgi:hypothetical protein
MREEQDDARQQIPLVLARRDELVDDDLGAVGEVAELGLPEHQRFGEVAAVAVLEAEHRGLGQHRVVDLEAGLAGGDVAQRHVLVVVLDVDQHRVALVEGAAPAVLPGQAHRDALLEERGEGDRLGHAVVERALALPHLGALLQQLLDLLVDVEALGRRGEGAGQRGDLLGRKAGRHLVLRFVPAAVVGVPVGRQPAQGRLLLHPGRLLVGGVELLADAGGHAVGLLGAAEALGIELPQRRMGVDPAVEPRLGDGRVVHLAVAVPAVADQVDHHIAVEGVTVVDRQGGGARHGLGDLAVDVEDRDRQALGDVGREARGVEAVRLGGEADHVVDHHVDGAAHVVALQPPQVEGLGEDPLAGEGGVAVQDDREDQLPGVVPQAVLLGPHAAEGDRIDRLQVARVGDQVDVDLMAVAAVEPAGRAHVVFDVARAEDAAGVDVLEAREDLGGRPADGVDHHVEPPTVAHGHHDLARPVDGGGLQHLAQQRDQRLDPLDGEALGPEIARLQHALEALGADELLEDRHRIDRRRGGLHALLDPVPALGLLDVHELHPDRTAIEAAGDLGRGRLAVLQDRLRLGGETVERIEVGFQIAQPAIGVERRQVQPLGVEQSWGGRCGFGNHDRSRIPHLASGRLGQVLSGAARGSLPRASARGRAGERAVLRSSCRGRRRCRRSGGSAVPAGWCRS